MVVWLRDSCCCCCCCDPRPPLSCLACSCRPLACCRLTSDRRSRSHPCLCAVCGGLLRRCCAGSSRKLHVLRAQMSPALSWWLNYKRVIDMLRAGGPRSGDPALTSVKTPLDFASIAAFIRSSVSFRTAVLHLELRKANSVDLGSRPQKNLVSFRKCFAVSAQDYTPGRLGLVENKQHTHTRKWGEAWESM
jgi:hypothetical protein